MAESKNRIIDSLADAAGIEPGYWDIWGKWVEIPREIKAELLEAIGFDLSSTSSAAQELAHFETRYRRSPLRPVTVVWQTALPAAIAVTIPLKPDNRWRLLIEAEQGQRFERLFKPSEAEIREIIDTPAGEQGLLRILIGGELDCGYHRVSLAVDNSGQDSIVAHSLLIVAPETCYLPPELLPDKKVFGIGVQIPSLCAIEDLGSGDLGHLAALINVTAEWGGAFVGVNPLHSVSCRDSGSVSPYSPESRTCFSPNLINVEAAARFLGLKRKAAEIEALKVEADPLRSPELVDQTAVWKVKRRVLLDFFQRFSREETAPALTEKFNQFCLDAPAPLRDYAAYKAIQDSLEESDPSIWGWPDWPEKYRNRFSPEVTAFIEQEKERIQFQLFLQWLVTEQIAGCRRQCTDNGMPIGLYLDLALGSSVAGPDIWANQDLYALNASLGAPPDMLNVLGQEWGLPPLVPFFLEYSAYSPFIEALRANMQFAGAIRIDHFMSICRLYWVPRGRLASEGAYIRYPFQELLGILALESQRNRCIVIGEDLGTVPDGLRQEMERRSILSYKVLPFMKGEDGSFVPPQHYIRKALVTSGTHDMATITGWWQGGDIDNWERFDLLKPPLTADVLRSSRRDEKDKLTELLGTEQAGNFDPAAEDAPDGIVAAVNTLLAATPSLLQVVQAEDLFLLRDQVNVPGTVHQHPNWRRRIPIPVEKWGESETACKVIAPLNGLRRQR